MKKLFSGTILLKRVLPLLLALLLCTGCQLTDITKLWGGAQTQESSSEASNSETPSSDTPTSEVPSQTSTPTDDSRPGNTETCLLNGVSIAEYSIVYSEADTDYSLRAAQYIRTQIKNRTGITLTLKKDSQATGAHEIVVGETERQISKDLDAETENVEFAILANESSVALEGDYFIIAAAAYFFVETYIPSKTFNSVVPQETTVHNPIQKKAKNFIFLIGDGMGFNQTLLFEELDVATEGDLAYSDGEDIFYGYYLPYQGESKTASASSSVTDSAAGGTALATGYRTKNGYVGKGTDGKDLQSLTELASSLGKATAVMSTESQVGATPASFSAHVLDREDYTAIRSSQTTMQSKYKTLIKCGYNEYTQTGVAKLQAEITGVLNQLSKDEDGFFLMYEEAYIDKNCHSKTKEGTFNALVRFNQAIGLFMEYAFYNPDTFVLITADHETGGLKKDDASGTFSFTTTAHTGANVPVFTYGSYAQVFDGIEMLNLQIPKTIARMMGQRVFGDENYRSLR